MELYGQSARSSSSQSDRGPVWGPVVAETGLEESMRRLGLWNSDSGFPERPGVADCTFYMRTGSCGYGVKCRYNHPRDRSSAGGAVSFGGQYPERPGEPACQFYLRTGTCKFGASCKFHHPRNGEGYTSIRVNSFGYPLRPGEVECSYYLKTGQCKFGIACKFHHPQLNGMFMPAGSARPFYLSVQTSSVPSPDLYVGPTATSFRAGRPPSLLPGSYVPGAYGPVLLPSGVVPIPSWSTYSGSISPVISPSAHAQPAVAGGSIYGVAHLPSSSPGFAGAYPTPLGLSAGGQKGTTLQGRPGQPDCQYYLKTGDCKFGSACRFNHPPDWVASKTNCAISPLGLPLRPGTQPCSFYMQNGYCKFGRMCKFDHPMGSVRYSPSASSLTDIPVAPYMVDPFMNRVPSSENFSTSSGSLIVSHTGPGLLSNVQISSQSSSARQGGKVRQRST